MWWCCNVPLTHVMPLQSTSTYVQWIPTVENVLESLLWGFTPVTLLAKHSTSRAWCHDSTFGVRINSGDRCLVHQWAREVTRPAGDLPRPTRRWESVSSNLAGPKRRITTSASTTVEAVERTTNRGCKKKIFQKPDSRPFKLHSPRIHICGRYWPIGCCNCVWIFIFHGDIDPWVAAF